MQASFLVRAWIGTGHPFWPIHPQWDFAPLLLSLLFLVLLAWARVPLTGVVLLAVFAAGLLLDGITDGLHTPLLPWLASMTLVAGIRRARVIQGSRPPTV